MIAAKGLYKSFGAIKAVRNVNLSAEKGSSLCIQGRSGCGKTTLLKMLASILTPDKGEVFLNDVSLTRAKSSDLPRLRSVIGYSFQEPLLLPYLTALENITTIISPVTNQSASSLRVGATSLLCSLGLSERLRHYPSKLSVGEKKRVDLARAIMKNPSVVIADEPFSNLDPETSATAMEALRDHLDRGGSLIYSSTDPSDSKFAKDCYRMTR